MRKRERQYDFGTPGTEGLIYGDDIMTSEELTELSPDDSFAFSCYPGISCFNACCRDLNQFLMPYDILRLKQNFSISSTRFLERYTSRHTGPQTGLPVVTLKPGENIFRSCPFVTADGCSVYDNRPSSCRIYPLMRLLSRSRQTGELSVRYMLLNESHCHGFENGRHQTVRQWIEHQGLAPYNEFNDAMMAVIALKNQLIPGPLPRDLAEIFDTALYDVDRFRQLLLDGRMDVSDAAVAVPDVGEVSDAELLGFSMKLMAEKIRNSEKAATNDINTGILDSLPF